MMEGGVCEVLKCNGVPDQVLFEGKQYDFLFNALHYREASALNIKWG